MQQGIAALWMQSAPLAAHLVGVANHALVALLFVWVLRRAGVASATAAIAGVLFVLSPLATTATAWLAASFDQLYIVCLLLLAAAVVRLGYEGMSVQRAAWILLATVAALLSKETAIVAPALVLLLGFIAWATRPQSFAWRPFAAALLLVLLPVLAYLLFRAPAIEASLAGDATAAYTPAAGNAPANAVRFFAYPFRLKLVEISANVFRSPWQPLAASLVHLLLVGAVWWQFGWRLALAYVAGYFLFLLPVLALPSPGAHLLYGAGLALALALAATLHGAIAGRHWAAAVGIAAAAVALYAHDLVIQRYFFDHGRCQARLLRDVDAWLAQPQRAGTRRLVIVPDEGALGRVAIRALSDREAYAVDGRPLVTFATAGTPQASRLERGTTRVHMTEACTLVAEAPPTRP
jgi:hypothetical protein